jgi:CRISPR/Cas system-associated exonuclease Cas4 (RecB family)
MSGVRIREGPGASVDIAGGRAGELHELQVKELEGEEENREEEGSMIQEALAKYWQSTIKNSPVHSNRASEIGHPCAAHLFFLRTRWQERPLIDVSLARIFAEGRLHEKAVLSLLADAGIEVVEQQRSFDWPEHKITGMVDGKIRIDGKLLPLEIKSMSPYNYDSINGIADMVNADRYYLQKYPAQLTAYCLMTNESQAVLLLKNKVSGEIKDILFDLDFDYAEKLLQKVELVNKCVADGTPPPAVWSENVCSDCDWQDICTVAMNRPAVEVVDDETLIAKLARLEELKPASTEYGKLDKEVSKMVKGVTNRICGNWHISGKMCEREGYTVKGVEYWMRKIKKIEGEKA